MLNSRRAFQLGEYSATWKHTTQGPLTALVNHTSETHVNRSNCAVTINCVSQKGRHCSEKLFILLLSARCFLSQTIRRVYYSFAEELPHSSSPHFFHEGSPQNGNLPDLVPLFASTGHQGLVLQAPNSPLSQKTEPGLQERQEHLRAHLKMQRFKGAGEKRTDIN